MTRTQLLASAACAALVFSGSAATAQPKGEATPAAPVTAPVPTAAAPLRIAVLDTQKVLRETEEGLRIEANLRKLFDAKQGELLQKEKQLSQEYEDLQKEEKTKGKSEGLERRKNEFKQKYSAYQQIAVELQRELTRKQNELYSPMLQRVGSIVKAFVQKQGIDVVLEKQAAVYYRTDLEITEQVIQAYNAGDTGTGKGGGAAKGGASKSPSAPTGPGATSPKK